MVIGRRWAARGWPRGRRRRCARARGPARRLGTDIHKLGPQEELDVGDDPSHTRSWPGTENTATWGACSTSQLIRCRRGRRSTKGVHARLVVSSVRADRYCGLPKDMLGATRVRPGSRPVRLNEVAAVDGPQARKTKKFSRKDAAPTPKNWWVIDPWCVGGALSAEAPRETPHAERAGRPPDDDGARRRGLPPRVDV